MAYFCFVRDIPSQNNKNVEYYVQNATNLWLVLGSSCAVGPHHGQEILLAPSLSSSATVELCYIFLTLLCRTQGK
jgi:hypothetical protein